MLIINNKNNVVDISCYLIKLSKVYQGPYAHAFVISIRCVARTVHIFVLCFTAQPLSGLVGKAYYLTINFTPNFWRGWNLPIIKILF